MSDPDLRAAFAAAPITFGQTSASATRDGNYDLMTIDGRIIYVGVPCDATPGCVPVPSGVTAFLGLLYGIKLQEQDRGTCTPSQNL